MTAWLKDAWPDLTPSVSHSAAPQASENSSPLVSARLSSPLPTEEVEDVVVLRALVHDIRTEQTNRFAVFALVVMVFLLCLFRQVDCLRRQLAESPRSIY